MSASSFSCLSEFGTIALLVHHHRFLALLDHFLEQGQNFGLGRRAATGSPRLDVLVLQRRLDQPDRAELALVAGLHGLFHFSRETFAHGASPLMVWVRALTWRERPLKSQQ